MATALNLTPQAISRWETGISYPDIAIIPDICRYLDVSADKLLDTQKQAPNKDFLNQSQIDSIFDYVPVEKCPGKNILIVDDAPFMRKMLTEILTPDGHSFTYAENGKECIDILNASKADICILDINMPVMDGLETLEIIRPKYPHLKIIILSIQCDEETVSEALRLGADGFVAKPFAAESIIKRMG